MNADIHAPSPAATASDPPEGRVKELAGPISRLALRFAIETDGDG